MSFTVRCQIHHWSVTREYLQRVAIFDWCTPNCGYIFQEYTDNSLVEFVLIFIGFQQDRPTFRCGVDACFYPFACPQLKQQFLQVPSFILNYGRVEEVIKFTFDLSERVNFGHFFKDSNTVEATHVCHTASILFLLGPIDKPLKGQYL